MVLKVILLFSPLALVFLGTLIAYYFIDIKKEKKMNSVYIVMSGEGYGKIIAVCRSKGQATLCVNMNARINWGIDVCRADCPPLDFDGALMRYGWADKCWWQKEVVY